MIGSLLWEEGLRRDWRERHLHLAGRQAVKAPIRYGRRSTTRAHTFTMVLDPRGPLGEAVLVPCTRAVETIRDLVDEAEDLWRAERKVTDGAGISAEWGCVGALFASDGSRDLKSAWTSYFHSEGTSVPPIDEDGILDIAWPVAITDDGPAEVDVILATATRAEGDRATISQIAEAWIGQDQGEERYFFLNVQHGIRTADDSEIAARMVTEEPTWIGHESYSSVLSQLSARE